MLFNSVKFLAFFLIVLAVFRLLPLRARRLMLLAASYYFYMSWKPEYLVLILASTLIDYGAARQIDRSESRSIRKSWLVVSLLGNLGILLTFKYWNFFGETVQAGLRNLNSTWQVPALEFLLPVGISFYTFQTLSYTIDVYRGQRRAESGLTTFALYVAFFPQLVAGPIERSSRLLPQLHRLRNPSAEQVSAGIRLIVWGFFLKIVVADYLAPIVDRVYGSPERFAGPSLTLATVFFAYQIYCDFAGYSAIALGCARLLGVDLMWNFDRPYSSRSLREFWRRWHISLSTWFRDYVYIPLGGSRGSGRFGRLRSLMVVFLLSGLWHGANWTFLAWGALHGTLLALGGATAPWRLRLASLVGLDQSPRLRAGMQVAGTFGLCTVAWVFFRADSISRAVQILAASANGITAWVWSLAVGTSDLSSIFEPWLMGTSPATVLKALGLITALEALQFAMGGHLGADDTTPSPYPLRWAAYFVVVCLILNVGSLREQPFIYFQF